MVFLSYKLKLILTNMKKILLMFFLPDSMNVRTMKENIIRFSNHSIKLNRIIGL